MNNYSVYMHKNKINGKIYIGKSNNCKKRWECNGIHYKPDKGKPNTPFWNAICKYNVRRIFVQLFNSGEELVMPGTKLRKHAIYYNHIGALLLRFLKCIVHCTYPSSI